MQLMEYCDLLDKADECDDPHMRMVYACEFALPSPATLLSCNILAD